MLDELIFALSRRVATAHQVPLMVGRMATKAMVVAGLAATACVPCNDVGCDAGFFWKAARADGEPLEAGTYAVALRIEDSTYMLDCTLSETQESSTCSQPSQTSGSVEFFVTFEFALQTGAPPQGFVMRTWEQVDERSQAGPSEVEISISHKEVPLFDVAFELEYVRDPDFWGDRKCGYCDLSEMRSSTW